MPEKNANANANTNAEFINPTPKLENKGDLLLYKHITCNGKNVKIQCSFLLSLS